MAAEQIKLTEKQTTTLWFVRLRWAAIGLLIAVIIASDVLGNLHIPLLPNFILIAFAIAYNLTYPYLIRRFLWFTENIFFTYLRATTDLTVITLMIHFTGGVGSPLLSLYLLELALLAIGGFVIPAYILSGVASLMYVAVTYLEANFIVPHYQLLDQPSSDYLNMYFGRSKATAFFLMALVLVYAVSYLIDRIKEKQKKIEELSDSKIDFMNTVMHEAKSPLTSVLGYIELVAAEKLGPLTAGQKEAALIIKRQSQRLLAMINDLLGLARLEADKTRIEKTRVNLADLISRVVEEFGSQLKEKNVEVVQEIGLTDPTVNLDESKIIEVMTNLLSNALKFSNEGGKIFISVSAQGNEVEVAVRDEGLGIDPADLPRIFEKFYRASKESAERKGTGLGLALSKSIVELHGGRIWVVSAGHGKGAVFYFALPLSTDK
ncbi:hypothetical protein A2625_06245 [candidate division WOR-1 bacterium RIFCSPHIGHO2_01_FULL_53_15]|uniref:histidine kinase n=1 Tax=candidate division WOR-1 bacterium RIFCSPHIGHO2_01_FULL_53_15 TaxID=1802564 RepID=A0A1F4Q1I8_UNCSA|nr:MAG: hypothetical protein A2625_06245 [candidate division WOR-1 bacterium RIFCSPHIGHO2_01_FULL_53_15]OGC13814.1 MAG: hypothetical protein A3D23_01980 [candidate division WOR-1 bacterium RIFCSPHIGHO2_02_FULL_53_26]